ncbi:MAG: ABC transporter ATP-binding protein [Betaproteobacteria bacterium]|nr:ABC transporter ATP-binding protein [Betaproteobacteria bacterium]
MRPAFLSVKQLKVAYGGIEAVRGVDLEVHERECVCVIGANGAGKSSLLKGLMNRVTHRGEVHLQDERLSHLPTHAIVERGLVLVPEGRGVFARMTVAENLDLGAYLRHDKAAVAADLAQVFEVFPRLFERRHQLAGTLSGGEQQMLAMGRALMARPRLLLLDEPSMGLAPLMVDQIYTHIARIAAAGTAILLIEQNAHLALQVSQRGYVMESGQMAFDGASADLAHDARVRSAYLGETRAD